MQLPTFIRVGLAIALLGFIGLGLNQIKHDREVKQIQRIEIKSNEAKLIELDNKYKDVLEQKTNTEAEKEEQQKRIDELESERERLERELQAKLNKQAEDKKKLAEAAKKATGTQTASAISGNKHDWLRASGIPESEWTYVDYIVSRESGWDPCAYNPGRSDCNANPTSACGLAQSLPCGKQSKYGHWTDPVANLKWQYEYVKGRYGGYAQAYQFWLKNKWY